MVHIWIGVAVVFYLTPGIVVAAAYSWDDDEISILAFALTTATWPVWLWLEFCFRASKWLHAKL